MPLHTGRIRLGVSVVVGLFSFLLLLQGVSPFFGGGAQGLVLALAVAVILFVLVLFFPVPHQQPTSAKPAPEKVEETPPPLVPAIDTGEGKETVGRRAAGVNPWLYGAELVCDPGPHGVESGEVNDIELDVSKGDRVRGTVVEVKGRNFNWYIVDQDGLVALLRGEKPESAAEGRRVNADKVSWKVRRNGPWFLALEISGRSSERVVKVDLRRA